MRRGLAVLLPFLPLALAWQPALDLELARQVVDGAYSRIPPLPTAAELSCQALCVKCVSVETA